MSVCNVEVIEPEMCCVYVCYVQIMEASYVMESSMLSLCFSSALNVFVMESSLL